MYIFTVQSTRFQEPIERVGTVRINGQWFKQQLRNLRDFFKATWLDWVTILAIGAVTAGIWVAPPATPAFERLFPVSAPGGAIYWPEIAHPYVPPIFSSAAAGVLTAVIPIFVFLIAQLWIQSFVNFGSAVLGLTYSMVTGTFFQVILKKTIGGLRPHFLDVCQPVILDASIGQGYKNMMYTAAQVCTGDKRRIKNALQSFPSGHANIAFAGLGFLAIYLFCHLRIRSLSRRRGSHWKLLLVIAPLLFATYLTSTLVLGYHHHGYDVCFGALIGATMAFIAYRTVFKGIWDCDWNTVPYLQLPESQCEGQKLGTLDGAQDAPQSEGSDVEADRRVSTASQEPTVSGEMV